MILNRSAVLSVTLLKGMLYQPDEAPRPIGCNTPPERGWAGWSKTKITSRALSFNIYIGKYMLYKSWQMGHQSPGRLRASKGSQVPNVFSMWVLRRVPNKATCLLTVVHPVWCTLCAPIICLESTPPSIPFCAIENCSSQTWSYQRQDTQEMYLSSWCQDVETRTAVSDLCPSGSLPWTPLPKEVL